MAGLLTRRTLLGVAAGAVGWCATGCSDDAATSTSPGTGGNGPGVPQRVVALGQGPDADTVIALGVTPVGMSAALTTPSGISPWTETALKGAKVELIDETSGLPVERVAALGPDLIVATTSYTFADNRASLEPIATAVGPETTADQESWQQTTRRIGAALSRAGEADRLVTETEAAIADLRSAHPDWEGRTFAMGPVIALDQLYLVNSTDDIAAVFLQQLGLVLAPTLKALPASDTPGRAVISRERLDLLDADVVLLSYFDDSIRSDFESGPLFQRLPTVQRGGYVDLDRSVAIAMAFPSVLSIPYALTRLEAVLVDALDGRR